MRSAELADFLRRRRGILRPEDVGLTVGARRRVAGLRREEVAAQAGMSVNYYTRLEQGRGPQPSTDMLAAISRALRLTSDERDYLYRIAGHSAPERTFGSLHVAPGLQRVLDRLDHTPALILSVLLETLVANHMAVALFGDHTGHTGLARYDVYRWFTDPQARLVYPPTDHARQSRAAVANLRVAYGQLGADSRAGEIARELRAHSDEFAMLWDRQEVSRRFEDHKTLIHPQLGAIELDCQALFTEDGAQTLLVLTAAPRSSAQDQLDLLAVIGTQRF